MKHHSLRQSAIHIFILTLLMSILGVSLVSFRSAQAYGDFLKQLGITKQEANDKISSSFLSGGLDYYGMKNLKSIITNDRATIVKDVAQYAKQFASSPEYLKQYKELKESHKPEPHTLETPEVFRENMIKAAKEGVRLTEESLKKAPTEMKAIFEKSLEAAKQNLKQTEDPNNKYIKAYTQNFSNTEKLMKESDEKLLKDWEERYPTNHLLYIKKRLEYFLETTQNIDFNAELVEKNGIKYFVKREYESKGDHWKMGFRAGKEAVTAARSFAQQWANEIR